MTLRDSELDFLEGAVERSKERRKTFFGERKTTKAEVAETILACYAPALIAEIRRLRNNGELDIH